MCGKGLPRWWTLPLDKLSTCICYSPRVHVIAGCIGDGSGTCHLLIAQHGHLWFLHVLGSYWTTCRDLVIPHVSFLLARGSCCGWVMCHFFIGPSVIFLLSTWRDHNTPHVFLLLNHVSRCCTSVCQYFIRQRVAP